MYKQTTSQTIGPFFHDALVDGHEHNLVNDQTRGARILISGRLVDGDAAPVADAMLEIWQADAQGYFNHPADPNQAKADPHFKGFGRAETDDEGRYTFKSIKPGPIAAGQAPYVNIRVFARGMLMHAVTRLYFSDEAANDHDPVLSAIETERRPSLIAHLVQQEDLPTYRFDIVLQGERETVFFDV